MNESDIKETMEQIHISEEMQEEIIMNIQDQMKNGKNKTRNWKKVATVAAALVLIVGVGSIPVQAVVKDIVRARMEDIPQEEVQAIADLVREHDTVAYGCSRDYTDQERERMKELWKAYEDGAFPEKTILQVENADGVIEGTLCYIKDTKDFYLPDRELTDEEILEIIDLNQKMSYAIEQSPAAQEVKAEMQEEQANLEEQVETVEGISEEEAIEIATNQMKSEIGERAEGKELLTVFLDDISDQTDFEHKGDVAYVLGFGNPSNRSTYTCAVDATDGSVLYTNEVLPKK